MIFIESTRSVGILHMAQLESVARSADFVQSCVCASSSGSVVVGASKSSSSASNAGSGETGTSTRGVVRSGSQTASLVVPSQTRSNSAGAKTASCTRGRADRASAAGVGVAKVALAEICDLAGAVIVRASGASEPSGNAEKGTVGLSGQRKGEEIMSRLRKGGTEKDE